MADTTTTFYIGKNVRQSAERPYEYTVVRHIPVTPDTFEAYGDNLLPNFNLLPTWTYATPHNIQRMTPQSRTCNSCHGNAEIFLTADKVKPEELEANKNVIVDQIPAEVPTDK
jgi:thiosulfate/3-mercaptopyruvate sulfurtransferase